MDANHGTNSVKDNGGDPPKTPLPEPDKDNITVLTSKLPNEPILPWNRYDSPWLESEEAEGAETVTAEAEAESEVKSEAKSEAETQVKSEAESPDVNTQERDTHADAASPEPDGIPSETSVPLSPTSTDERPVGETTIADTMATPLPATNHYLIDLAFEGTTD